MAAVLAPGLGDRFQLDIGRFAAQIAEVVLNRFHLDERQTQLSALLSATSSSSSRSRIGTVTRLEAIRRAEMQADRTCSGPTTTCSIAVVGQQLSGQAAPAVCR